MYINFNFYRVFYYVAKYKSFTRAASILLSNQPNITRTIKHLEEELGCTLFERSNRGVLLTPEGEKLYAHIRIAFEHIQAGEEELSSDKSLQSGIVSIGVSETALRCLLLPILKQFHTLYPGIRIRISNHSTPQALTALKNGLVDLAVVTSPMELPSSLEKKSLCSFQEVGVCGNAFADLAGRKCSLQELLNYPIICLSSATKTYEFYSQLFLKHHLVLEPDIEAATADQILPMVSHDLGIGFVPESFIGGHENVWVLDLQETIPPRQICLVKRSHQTLSLAAKALQTMILDSH